MVESKLDKAVKLSGILFVVISGLFAFWQYRYAQERDYKKYFFEQQVQLVGEIMNVLVNIDSAKDEQERKESLSQYWGIYFGKARFLLNENMFDKFKRSTDYIVFCVEKKVPPGDFSCENVNAVNSATGFAIEARRQLSDSWKLGLSEFSVRDPWAPVKK